jgi:hypothetical protein
MIVLESSSNEKETYYIILDHENIRFLNNYSLYLFVEEVHRVLLLITIDHQCVRNKNSINKKFNNESSFLEIIEAFNFVWIEWFNCIDCKIKNINFSVSDVCSLFAYTQKGFIVPCIDFKVYSVEQDFPMFMCTKKGEERPSKRSILFEKTLDMNAISSKSSYNLKSH